MLKSQIELIFFFGNVLISLIASLSSGVQINYATIHPDKTTIGRIDRGFDFLGYWFTADEFTVSRKMLERCALRLSRLYEQGATSDRIREYVRHSHMWMTAGLTGFRWCNSWRVR